MDRREKGLLRTLAALDAEGLAHVGTRADPDADPTLWFERNGFEIAFLAYTFSTNGIPLPPGRSGIVSLIDGERMVAEITAAREAGADLVVVGCHWGIEYRHAPEAETVELAHELVEAGADVILGGHPHFIQPYEVLTASDGHEAFVIYSLGNFYTNMRKRYQDAGMVLRLTYEGIPGQTPALVDVSYLPTWVDVTDEAGATHHQVVDINAALPSCGHAPRLDAADCAAMEQALADTIEVLGPDDMAEPEPAPTHTDPTGGAEAAVP
jgi:poly-gamma-glutamate synthesis protein (capsule biosynthesis protein)